MQFIRLTTNYLLLNLVMRLGWHDAANSDAFLSGKEDIITGEVEVIRVETREDSKRFGCKMKKLSPELNQYITNRKLSVYMKTIKE